MKLKPRTVFSGILSATMLALANPTPAQDAPNLSVADPEDAKVLVDNADVHIMEVTHAPGGHEPMHHHPAYVAVFLTDATLRETLADGTVRINHPKAGSAVFKPEVTHKAENIGDTVSKIIVIELKHP